LETLHLFCQILPCTQLSEYVIGLHLCSIVIAQLHT